MVTQPMGWIRLGVLAREFPPTRIIRLITISMMLVGRLFELPKIMFGLEQQRPKPI